ATSSATAAPTAAPPRRDTIDFIGHSSSVYGWHSVATRPRSSSNSWPYVNRSGTPGSGRRLGLPAPFHPGQFVIRRPLILHVAMARLVDGASQALSELLVRGLDHQLAVLLLHLDDPLHRIDPHCFLLLVADQVEDLVPVDPPIAAAQRDDAAGILL